uniref:Intermembrane lipid transfer protein VPS13-like C-terminal domain-containing protein n=1 Tax=Arcella intermedia TaxID=1963864 RepID=A0A6B2L7G6_9EUKA
MRRDQYLSSITERYSEAWFSLMATFLGSADILGSPLGIVSNLSSGVKDFFEEPAKAIKNDPSQLGLAMAKGTAKLISKTVVLNVFGTTSKITSALSNVTSRASFDKKYLSERNLKSHIKPKHAGEGIAMGVMGLGRGIFDGVTGVITQPIKGAKEEGAVGLLKGFGKGIVGLAIKPSVGAIDLVSKSTEGIANTTHYLEKDKKIPRRPPRFIGERSVITVYDRYKSEGQKLMKTLNDGNFKDHVYYWHVVLAGEGKKATILMTQTNFFYIFKPPIKVGPTNYIIKYNLSYHYIERWFVNNSTSSLYIKLRSLPSSPSSRNITVQPQIKPAETPIPEAQYQNMIEIHCKELGVLQQIQKYLNLIIRGE